MKAIITVGLGYGDEGKGSIVDALVCPSQPDGTWSDVTPRNAVQLCESVEIPFEILGVTRTYLTRHGGRLANTFQRFQSSDDHNIPNYQDEMFEIEYCNVIFKIEELGISCSILGKGPTHQDKTFMPP